MIAKLMSRVFKKMGKEEKGFTLIELLAVIVILAVIAVIAVPMIGNIISKSKTDADLATAKQVYDAARLYVIGEKGGDFKGVSIDIINSDSNTKNSLIELGYLEANLTLPSTKAAISTGSVVFGSDGKLTSVTLGSKTYTAAEVLSQTAATPTT